MTGPAKNPTPWRSYKGMGLPHEDTLRQWRVAARKLAQAAGFYTACDLCKRPIKREHRFGRVMLRPARAWRGRATQRTICHSCYITMQALLQELESLGARDHLPAEDYSDYTDEEIAAKEKEKGVEVLPIRDEQEAG